MLYIEAYKTAIKEMDSYYFEQHPDGSFNYFLFKENMSRIMSEMTDFLEFLDQYKFYKAPKNKEDNKLDDCPEHIKMLWGATKIACFLIAVPDLNYKDLIYHNIEFSIGRIYNLHKRFEDSLSSINENLQSIVLNLHPQGVTLTKSSNECGFFRASKSEKSFDVHVSPSFVRRPLTYT